MQTYVTDLIEVGKLIFLQFSVYTLLDNLSFDSDTQYVRGQTAVCIQIQLLFKPVFLQINRMERNAHNDRNLFRR